MLIGIVANVPNSDTCPIVKYLEVALRMTQIGSENPAGKGGDHSLANL